MLTKSFEAKNGENKVANMMLLYHRPVWKKARKRVIYWNIYLYLFIIKDV